MVSGKYYIFKSMRIFFKLLFGLAVFVALVFLALQTPWGKRIAADGVGRLLSNQLDLHVSVDGLEGFIPFETAVAGISVRDDGRDLLSIKDLRWRWIVSSLFRGTLDLEHVTAQNATLFQALSDRDGNGAREWDPENLLKIMRVNLGRVEIYELVLEEGLVPAKPVFSVSGSFKTVGGHTGIMKLSAPLKIWNGVVLDGGEFASGLEFDLEIGISEDDVARAQLTGLIKGSDILLPDWKEVLGHRVEWTAQSLYSPGKELSFNSDIRGGGFYAEASASIDLSVNDLHASVLVDVPDLSTLDSMVEREIDGDASLDIRASGPIGHPHVEALLSSNDFRYDAWRFADTEAELVTSGLVKPMSGQLSMRTMVREKLVQGSSEIAWENGQVSLAGISVEGLISKLQGELSFYPAEGTLEGELELSSEDISELGSLAGIELSGGIVIAINMDRVGGMQDFSFEGHIKDIRHTHGGLEYAVIAAHVENLGGDTRGAAELLISELSVGELVFANAEAELRGDLNVIRYEIEAQGRLEEDVEFYADGDVGYGEALEYVHIEKFNAMYGSHPVNLLSPATFRAMDEGYAVEHVDIRIGPGFLVASGRISPEWMDVSLSVTRFPMRAMGLAGVLDEEAEVEGEIHLTGRPDNPEGRLSIVFSGIQPRHIEYWDAPPAVLEVEGILNDRHLSMEVTLEKLSELPANFFLAFPVELSFHPPAFSWSPDGDMEGRLSVDADLGRLARLFLLDLHYIRGDLSARYDISGTISDPAVSGLMTIKNGAYDNDRTGTVLRDIEIAIIADDGHLRIEHAAATDGSRGRLDVNGRLRLSLEERFPFKLEGRLNRLHVVNQDFMDASASGSLIYEGTAYESLLSGELVFAPVEVTVPERIPPGVADLDIVEIHDEDEKPEAPVEPRPRAHAMNIDLTLRLPDRGFLRGRGLDSEWSGQVDIRGSADEPDIRGELSVVRGRFNFFGRRLQITRGIVTFGGEIPPAPYLDVSAETRVRGVTGILRMSGVVTAPDITLDSIPPMPDDEILARLLFGRDASRITPWQALVMAQAVNSMRREGTTFDFMGRTRRILGVDQFEVRQPEEEEGATTVSVGKYVRDGVYVELERGADVDTGLARVEIELFPTITLETMVGADAEGGLGINWGWDY